MSNFQKIQDREKWKELLEKALFKTFFHKLQWEEFLESRFGWLKFERYLYRNEALLSLARYRLMGKEKLVSHPFCEYGGVLPLKSGINGREFRQELFGEFKDELKIKFHPQLTQYFRDAGFKEPDSESDAYFLEDFGKKSAEEIQSGFRKTLRHSIEKAERENLEIEKCANKKDLKDFYGLYAKTMKSHNSIPYPRSFFEYFLNSPDCEIILAKCDKKVIAGSVFVFYDKFVHYFINASDFNRRDKGANYLILWNQIKKYSGKGYEVFDFGGTGRGSDLEVFKAGWGAKKYAIFQLKNYKSNGMKKSKLRNVLKFLPAIISSKLLKFRL